MTFTNVLSAMNIDLRKLYFEKDAKERKDLENDIALLRSDLYSGTKSQQSGRSAGISPLQRKVLTH